MNPTPPTDDTVLFTERRKPSFVFVVLGVGMPLMFAYLNVEAMRDGDSFADLLGANLIAVVLLAFIYFLFLGPWGGEFRHLRVDHRGVWMRRKLLPAEQIERISVLGEAEAARAVFTARHDGMWLLRGVYTYNPISTHGRAVYLVQRRPDGTRRPWILGTHHPRELTDAARAVRDAARRAHTPPPT